MRVDVYLVSNAHCESRSRAQALIDKGLVEIDGAVVTRQSLQVDERQEHAVVIKQHSEFVGRGALKLEAAIKEFGLDVSGKRCIDVGASTGGFTQYLLMCGAQSVTAVDAGRGQLHKSLLEDSRVTSVEGFNARELSAERFGMFDCAVMDVSFISQTLIIPSLSGIINEGGCFVSLIKPQFEAGREAVGKGGIVKRASDRERAMLSVLESAVGNGFSVRGLMLSPILGGDGNTEYLACFVRNGGGELTDDIRMRAAQLSRMRGDD